MPGKATKKTSPNKNKMKETRVSPETAVAATAAEPAAGPRKRSVKTAAGDRALPASKPRTQPTTKHRSAKPTTVAPRAPALAMAAVAGASAGAGVAAGVANERIAELAYSYWLARGRQGGNQQDDWFRAEHEFRSRLE